MERRDIIKDEIERLGKALGKILADFLQLKAKGKVMEGIEMANEQLQNEIDLDVNKVLNLNKEELMAYFKQRKLTAAHIEILADYFWALGESQEVADSAETKLKLSKAAELLDIADEISKTMSFERIAKREKLTRCLSS